MDASLIIRLDLEPRMPSFRRLLHRIRSDQPLKSGVDRSSLLNQHGFTGYKIGAAKYHLLKARETYPRMPLYPNPPPEVVDFLFNIDAFFYSAWSALDFLSREINSTYFLGLEDPKLKFVIPKKG